MIELEVADLVVIASRTLSLDTGRALGLLDPAAAKHALAQARQGGEPADPASRAAALLGALVRQRPLRRGNQQVALVAMLQFLAINGWDTDPDPPGAVAAVVAGLAAGTLGAKDVADWLAPRLRPADRAAARVKEAPMRGRPALLLAERIKKATMRTQPRGMFQRFTDRARRAVCLAQEEARLLRHSYVGTEHLLLGLLYEEQDVAAKALESMGITLEGVRGRVEEIAGHGQSPVTGHIPFAPGAKQALELSLREALALGHNYLGTEHILLGLLREGDGTAAQVLTGFGAGHARVRERVLDLHGEREQAHREMELIRLAIPADLADTAEQLAQVQRQKEAAFDAGDLGSAAALRDREKQLLADKLRLEHQLTAGVGVQVVIAENRELHHELDRLRDLLRRHGIEPNDGTARTA
jgi:prophage maintenance system killer protein